MTITTRADTWAAATGMRRPARRARWPWCKVRHLTDVSLQLAGLFFLQPALTSSVLARTFAGSSRAERPAFSRTSSNGPLRNPDERDGADPSDRAAPMPRPAERGTGRGGRGPQPGPGGHLR